LYKCLEFIAISAVPMVLWTWLC